MKNWPNTYAQGDGWIVDCGMVDGKRVRKYFRTKTAAQKEAQKKREERSRGMMGALALSDADLMDAVAAKRILAGTGITLGRVNTIYIGDLFGVFCRDATYTRAIRPDCRLLPDAAGQCFAG